MRHCCDKLYKTNVISAKIPREFANSTIYILPVIEMSRPSRDHIAFSQMSTATVSSLAYPYFKHDFKQDTKSKPSLTKEERNK